MMLGRRRWGWNFRSTHAFVTDRVGEMAAAGNTGPAPDPVFPIARNNIPFGWIINGSNTQPRDRNAATDRRLAGVIFTEAPTISTFRIILPAPGRYTIRAAFGDFYGARTDGRIEVLDDTRSKILIDYSSGFSTGSTLWRDANDVLRTAADFTLTYEASGRTVDFASSVCNITLGSATQYGWIAHFSIEWAVAAHRRAYRIPAAAAPSGGKPWLHYARLRNRGAMVAS